MIQKEYFSHDYGTRHKKKLSALIKEKKMRGYGLFWVIVEMLHEDSTRWMELDELTYISIEKESGEPAVYVKDFIGLCISRYKVFQVNGNQFTTERVLRNIDKRLEIKEMKSKAGKASAAKKQHNSTGVQQVSTGVQHNSTKESKVKESKENNTEPDVVIGPWFEMFRRAAGSHIDDDELILEIGKFVNRYPNNKPNVSGALVNTWVSRIGEQPKEVEIAKKMNY